MKKLLLLLTLALCAPMTFAQNVPSYVPSDGLVGYWPFNGNANDESGNNHNGTVNGATLTTDRFGNANSAYSFITNSDIIQNQKFNISSQNFTISVWCKVLTTFNYTNFYLVAFAPIDHITPGGFSLGLDQNDNAYGNNMYELIGSTNNSVRSQSLDFNSINQWNNFIFSKNDGITKLYLNGQLLDSNIDSGIINYANSCLQFGNYANINNNLVGNRLIDDIGIWNRALTEQEITTMYNSVEVPTYSDTCNNVSGSLTQGLVGYWPFCGNANDDSGNGNNGTVNGATLTTDRFGNANSAYSFDGIGNYIQTNCQGVLGNDYRTISFWAKTNSSLEMAAFSYGASTTKGNRFDGYFNFNLVGCTANIAGGAVNYSTPSPVNDNNWHNYIYVVNQLNSQVNNIKIYQDGILLTNVLNTYDPNTNINTLSEIGLRFGKTTYPGIPSNFNGQLDDFGFWNRALNQQEITQLYNQNQCITNITVTDTLVINVGQLSYTNPIYYANNITLYPNPANTQVNISFTNITDLTGGQIKIINSLGQQVATTPITLSGTNTTIPITTWGGAGLYFVQILNAQGIVVDVKKIILQ